MPRPRGSKNKKKRNRFSTVKPLNSNDKPIVDGYSFEYVKDTRDNNLKVDIDTTLNKKTVKSEETSGLLRLLKDVGFVVASDIEGDRYFLSLEDKTFKIL